MNRHGADSVALIRALNKDGYSCHFKIPDRSFYKKELIFYRVTDALFIFVVRHCNAVQICLMAVIQKVKEK